MIRQPIVAGTFYPADKTELVTQVDSFLQGGNTPNKVKGIIVPHAGYVYSGAVAGEVFRSVEIPNKVILLGPNHHGAGQNIAASGAESWDTPLGNIPIATTLRDELVAEHSPLVVDDVAHQFEHSIEVMLPFLQRRQPKLEIVPIAISSLSATEAKAFGNAIARTIMNCNEEVLLLASTDMNHFATAKKSKELDYMAITAMEKYAPEQLYQVVRKMEISMCGMLPTVVAMHACHALGASDCRLLRYAHSGQVNGDNNRVVGYAGLTLE